MEGFNLSDGYAAARKNGIVNECVDTLHVQSQICTFLWIQRKPKQTMCIHKHCSAKGRLNVPTALGHMLMPPAQRWADNQCVSRIPHVPFVIRHQLAATAFMCPGVGFDPTVWDVEICGIKWCILHTVFVYMTMYHVEIKLVWSFSVL